MSYFAHEAFGCPKKPINQLILSSSAAASTNTLHRYWSVVNQMDAVPFTYVRSSVLGDSFIINEDGFYSINYQDDTGGGSNSYLGISLNEAPGDVSTGITNLAVVQILGALQPGSGVGICTLVFLKAGSTVRVKGNAASMAGSTNNGSQFRMFKLPLG